MMMQHREQPFFKPLSEIENGQINRQSSYFAPLPLKQQTENARMEQKENQQSSSEKLSAIHKLQQEYYKKRVQTEIDLKQKEKKIQEYKQTTEQLRKSLLEIQISNENLNLKLQEEMSNREEIVQKINATRDMCNLLKDHTAKVEDRLEKCEAERTDLKYVENQQTEKLSELLTKFEELQITATKKQNELNNQIQLLEEKKAEEEQKLSQKLSEAESKLEALRTEHSAKEDQIIMLTSQLALNETKAAIIEKQLGELQVQLKEREQIMGDQTNQLEDLMRNIQTQKELKSNLETALQDAICKLEQSESGNLAIKQQLAVSEKNYVEKVKLLEDNLQKTKEAFEQEKQRFVELHASYEVSRQNIDGLEKVRDGLICEKDLAHQKIKELESEKDLVEQHHEKLKTDLETLSDEKCIMQTGFQQLQETHEKQEKLVESLNDDIARLIKEGETQSQDIKQLVKEIKANEKEILDLNEKIAACVDQENSFREEIKKLNQQIKEDEENRKEIEKQLASTKKEKSAVEKELKIVQNKTGKLEVDLKASSSENSVKQMQLQEMKEENDTLKNTVEELEKNIELLNKANMELQNQEENTAKIKQNELVKKEKEIGSLDSKMKSLKADVGSKNKQIKDLEKEVKHLKSKLNSKGKSVDDLKDSCKEYKDAIEKAKLSELEIRDQLDSVTQELDAEKENNAKLKKEAMDLKANADAANKEKQVEKRNCEGSIKEMTRTLEKYKTEYQKIVNLKEEEIQQLKNKLEKQGESEAKNMEEVTDLQSEIKQLKTKLDTLEAEKANSVKASADQELKIETLRTEIAEKEAEFKDLLTTVDQLRKENAKLQQLEQQMPSAPATPKKVKPVNIVPTDTLKTPVLQTRSPKTPKVASVIATPQRSILKQGGSVSKKRRVAFASQEEANKGSDSDSSSSELMEVELGNVDDYLKCPKPRQCVTPLIVKPSPKVKSPASMQPKIPLSTKKRIPLNPVLRGKTIDQELHSKKLKMDGKRDLADELEQFKSLFPEDEHDGSLYSNTKKKKSQVSVPKSPTHVRRTPSKTTSKFFKSSPKDRMKKKALKGNTVTANEVSWFDSDAVFGFGPED